MTPGAFGDSVAARCTEVVVAAGDLVRAGAAAARALAGSADPDNPTTDLDRRVDAFLAAGLVEACAGLPGGVAYVSEERPDDGSRRDAATVLVVDPIDGTRGLLLGRAESAVSVAAWAFGDLRWACVHNPFTGETWTAHRGGGTWRDGARLHVSAAADLGAAELVLSRHEHERGMLRRWDGRLRYRPVGSIAYKMALVAEGRADATMTAHPRYEWDVAAGILLVREAGGRVTDAAGVDLGFNGPDLVVPGIVASNGLLHPALLDVMRDG
jgi:myo-inositol-1(or 4)-monophosphatase